jgi:hypothetical protein
MWRESYPEEFRNVMSVPQTNFITAVVATLGCSPWRARKMINAYRAQQLIPTALSGRPPKITAEMCAHPDYWVVRDFRFSDEAAAAILRESLGIDDIGASAVARARTKMQLIGLDEVFLMRFQFLHEFLADNGLLREIIKDCTPVHFDQLLLRRRKSGRWEVQCESNDQYMRKAGNSLNVFIAMRDGGVVLVAFSFEPFTADNLREFLVKKEFKTLIDDPKVLGFCDRGTFQDCPKARKWICENICRLAPGWPSHSGFMLPVQKYFTWMRNKLAEEEASKLERDEVRELFLAQHFYFFAKEENRVGILDLFRESYQQCLATPGATLPFTEEIDQRIISLVQFAQKKWDLIGQELGLSSNMVKERYRFRKEVQRMFNI